MKKYLWAVNPIKLERAIKEAGKDGTEEIIKNLYVSYGGLILKIHDTTSDTEDDQGTTEEESVIRGSKRPRVGRPKQS